MENFQQPLTDKAQELRSQLGPQLEEARQNLAELNQRVTTFIRQRPGTCLLGALAVGFIIGKIASR